MKIEATINRTGKTLNAGVSRAGTLQAGIVKTALPGEDGGYYIPVVSSSGNLSWTPSKSDMPPVESVNIKGAPGVTPKKGVDYYTDADKEEMVSAVIAALPDAEGGSF